MRSDTFRILVLVVKRVGEILVSTPLIRALRKSYPDAEITVAIDQNYEAVLLGNPYIDGLFLLDPDDSPITFLRKVFDLRKMHFTMTIDLLANPRSALISLLSGSPVRFGFNKRIRKLAYNRLIPSYSDVRPYIADKRLNVIRALNKNTDGTELDIFIDEQSAIAGRMILAEKDIQPDDPIVTVSPVSLHKWKLWPFEKYANVIDYLIHEKKRKVVLVCGPGEYHFLEKVMNHMKYQPSAAIEFHQIKVLGYVLKQAVLHIGNNGGIQYLASASGISTITIFGPGNANLWNEYEDQRHIALWKEISCRGPKCYRNCYNALKCLKIVSFRDVKRSIDLLL